MAGDRGSCRDVFRSFAALRTVHGDLAGLDPPSREGPRHIGESADDAIEGFSGEICGDDPRSIWSAKRYGAWFCRCGSMRFGRWG